MSLQKSDSFEVVPQRSALGVFPPNYPEAYIHGFRDFMGLRFSVDERVYVPAPETAHLVVTAEEVLRLPSKKPDSILDVGTGSGVIGLSLAKRFPGTRVVAADISRDALEVACANRTAMGEDLVELVVSDLISALPRSPVPNLIVANLPWGSPEHLLKSHSLEELAYMPDVAIFPSRGLVGSYIDLIEQIQARRWKTILLCEVGVLPRGLVEEELYGVAEPTWFEKDGYAIMRVDF